MESCGDYDEINDNQPVGDYETTINPNDYCSTPPVPPLSEHEIPMATMEYEIPVSTLGKVCCVWYDYYYRNCWSKWLFILLCQFMMKAVK